MRITIIGAGNVGLALSRSLLKQGDSVVLGVPDPAKYAETVSALGPGVTLLPTLDAIAASDLVILAVPYSANAGIATSVADWQGKILVDATNPLAPGLNGLSIGTTTSGAEELAKLAKGARVVKAFNTTGADNMADPSYGAGRAAMLVCGDDVAARQQVMAIADRIGFEAVDCGGLSAARYTEPFAMTWIHLAIRQQLGRNFAFSILRRD